MLALQTNEQIGFVMNGSNIPDGDGLIEYREAHSPFQKLIDSQRKRCGLSGRELAERIGVSQSTLWIWLHNLNGFPEPKSFNSEHVRRLGEVLEISESKIKAALDASRRLFTSTETPVFPPRGRLIEYREAHSPFQKLIDLQRKRYRLSGRQLAERIGVSQSTLWIWLHNLNGYPHPKSFKELHLQRLSRVLKTPANKIKRALDASSTSSDILEHD